MRDMAQRAGIAVLLTATFSACKSDTTGLSSSVVPRTCLSIEILPGEDRLIEGSDAVDCLEFAPFEAGEGYEIVVSTMSRTLTYQPMELRITPLEALVAEGTAGATNVPVSAGDYPTGAVDAAWRNGQFAMDALLRELEAPLLQQIRMIAHSSNGGLFGVPFLGQRVAYDFACVSNRDYPNAPDRIAGVVRHVSDHAVIVEDVEAGQAFTPDEYEQIGNAFDDVIYDTNVSYFGEPADIDANGGRIVLLYTPGVNRLSDDYGESFISGFTCPLDLGSSGGNRAEMFYLMVPDPEGVFTDGEGDGISKQQVRRITDNTAAHELQHLINAQRGNGGAQDVWLNEGLSHLAEEVVGHAVNGLEPGTSLGSEDLLQSSDRLDVFNKYYLNNWFNLSRYLGATADTAALLNSSDPLDVNTFRMRGAAWSFVRYLLDRFDDGSIAEAARTRSLVASSNADSRDAITEVFGEPFDRLATQWSMMLVSADREEVSVSPELALSSYRIREVFDSRVGLAVNPPSGGYPLRPQQVNLSRADTIDARLFPATGLYVEISAEQSGPGTRLELVRPGTGGRLDDSVQPRIQVLRVR